MAELYIPPFEIAGTIEDRQEILTTAKKRESLVKVFATEYAPLAIRYMLAVEKDIAEETRANSFVVVTEFSKELDSNPFVSLDQMAEFFWINRLRISLAVKKIGIE